MRKNLGKVNALAPVPLVVVGTEVDGKPNYILVGHTGIMDHGTLSVSLFKSRYSVRGIEQNKTLSINLLTEEMLAAANEAARHSGREADKSGLFEAEYGTLKGAPLIKNAPVSMECRVVDVYDRPDFHNYICEIVNTYADEAVLSGGRLDLCKVKPILFAGPDGYCRTGDRVRKTLND